MTLRSPSYGRLLRVGVVGTPIFLLLLAVLAGSECAGPCSDPFWTRPLMVGLFLLGPVSVAAGAIGLASAAVRRRRGVGDGRD